MEWRAEVGRCGFVSRPRNAMERHARERGGASASGRDKGRAGRDGRAAAAGVTVKCYQSGAERTVAGSSRGVAGSPVAGERGTVPLCGRLGAPGLSLHVCRWIDASRRGRAGRR